MSNNNNNDGLLNISLVIDENNITHIDIDSNKTNNVNILIGKVCKKYNLDNKIKDKLGKEINKRIDEIIKNKTLEKRKNNENTINRLYYESVEKNKKKAAFLEGMRKEKENEILNTLTFTPNINKNSNLLYEKRHLKIEDKLYNEFKVLKEKNNFTRLITEISQRSKSNNKNKNNSKYNEQKNNSMQAFKKNNFTKNSINNTNLKENKSEGNLLIFKKLQSNSKEKIIINNELTPKNQYEKIMIINTNNSTDKNFNLEDVSLINKNKTYNTEDSLEDSYLNLKTLHSKYKAEDKNINLNKIPEIKENDLKTSILGNSFNFN